MFSKQPEQFTVLGAGYAPIGMIEFICLTDNLPLYGGYMAPTMVGLAKLNYQAEQVFLYHREWIETFGKRNDARETGYVDTPDGLVWSSSLAKGAPLFITIDVSEFPREPVNQGDVSITDMDLRGNTIGTRACMASPDGKSDHPFAVYDTSDIGSLDVSEMVVKNEFPLQSEFLNPVCDSLGAKAKFASDWINAGGWIQSGDLGNLISCHLVRPGGVLTGQPELAGSLVNCDIAESQQPCCVLTAMSREQDFELLNVGGCHPMLCVHNR